MFYKEDVSYKQGTFSQVLLLSRAKKASGLYTT